MPLPLAIICGILLAVLIYGGGVRLILLSILLLPIYYAIKNAWMELPKDGKWKVNWERFFKVIFVELIVGIILAVAQSEQLASISWLIMAYFLYMLSTSLFISITKDIQKHLLL